MEKFEFDKIILTIDGEFATLTFNDPDHLNALSMAMVHGVSQAFHELSKPDHHIRALLIRSEGRGFCAGLNLKNSKNVAEGPISRMQTHFLPMLRHMKEASFPIVAAVNGPCAGIGVTLALMCDVVVANRSAYFTLPFVKNLAAMGDAGISWLLPRIIGWSRAKHMFLFGTKVGAEKALEWGMVYDVFDDEGFHEKAEAVARELASGPTVALAGIRKFIWEGLENNYDRHLFAEIEINATTHPTADYKEALTAFLERRPPDFQGK